MKILLLIHSIVHWITGAILFLLFAAAFTVAVIVLGKDALDF